MKRLMIPLFLLALIGLVYYSYNRWFEEYEYTVHTGASQAALRNPYLAAQRFLQHENTRLEVVTGAPDFANIPDNANVFLSEVDNIIITESHVNAALDWLNRGGTILAGVGVEPQGYASLVARLGVEVDTYYEGFDDEFANENLVDEEGAPLDAADRMREINRRIKEQNEADAERADDTAEEADGIPTSEDHQHEYFLMQLQEVDEGAQVAVVDNIKLYHESWWEDAEDSHPYTPTGWSQDEHGVRLVQFDVGEGRITLFSSANYWTNDRIGIADHAFLLRYFIHDGQPIYFYADFVSSSLLQLMRKYMPELILITLLLTMLWLWNRAVRVTAIRGESESRTAPFEQHLIAASQYLENREDYQSLLAPLYQDIETQMRKRNLRFKRLSESQQVNELYEHTQVSKDVIQQFLLTKKNPITAEQFEFALRAGRSIRNQL
ncbi:MAG: DUF4350 domain-containing protein [Pseudomonadota bacterium]